MQSFSGTVSSPSNPTWEFLARVVRYFAAAPVVHRPAIRWEEMKPVDFQGDDTSLTQEQISLMR
jgi:hypothetical protein